MTSGPRHYTAGTERALFRLSSGTCYFPDCKTPVIRMVGEHPIVEVEIAHIRGAQKTSARYDSTMTDSERAAFANLILLCTPHHKLVDRLDADSYPVALLQSWKTANEPADGTVALEHLVTEANFETLLEKIARALRPTRNIEVALSVGFFHSQTELASSPPEGYHVLLRNNPHWATLPQAIIATVRNIGTLPVGVEAIDLYVGIPTRDRNAAQATFTLMGRNDFQHQNPTLPHRLQDGDAMQWLTRMETLRHIVSVVEAQHSRVSSLWWQVRLATGDVVESAHAPWPFPDAWPSTLAGIVPPSEAPDPH
jgi:hypothetical protein